MSQEFLSQDEVNSLLKGAAAESGNAQSAANEDVVRPYNLGTQERIVRGRMPALDIINERFARLFRVALFHFMRRSAEVAIGPVRVQKYGEFIRNLVQPTSLNIVQVKPLRGTGLFVFSPDLVLLVVDSLFGGDGRFHSRVEGREFTPTEQQIIRRLLEVVFETYQKAWSRVTALAFEALRTESHTQFANIATLNEVVVTTSFSIELGPATGELHICLPYAMLEPIREILYSSLKGDQMEADRHWVRMLSKQVQSAEVELVAKLGGTDVTIGQVMQLKSGDVIPIDIPSSIEATIDGIAVMDCHYGVFNGRYAVRVLRMINHGQNETLTQQANG